MEFRLPEIGEGLYEAELIRWLVQPGDTVKHGQSLLEAMTDKATMEVPSPFVGTIKSLHASAGDKIKVGGKIITFDGTFVGAVAAPADATVPTVARNGAAIVVAVPASAAKAAPSVRHLARKLGIDLGHVQGTGPGGRILIEDLKPAIMPTQPTAKPGDATMKLDVGKPGTKVKLIGLRRAIAEHMVESKRTIPHYSYVDECDVTDLVKLRESTSGHFTANGIKLTYLAFFIKAAAGALRDVPIVNATLDNEAIEVTLHDHYHIGFAVATPAGLIVPVIRDADRKDLATIAREVESLSAAARAGKSKREDLIGGTFTVTSIGNVGGLISTPIINHPQVGIVGLGKIVKRPVYDDHGAIRPASQMFLSFSFDHRIVDGAVGAMFGNALIRRMQQPASLLLPEKL
jgi:pyruvate dehydrogenase E2 component (dihydrolipoamide acetyltransferase)/2-oxoisovalerate dehydrogenase E2 component (dihydrolipoyl transacylase)